MPHYGVLNVDQHARIANGVKTLQQCLEICDSAEACGCNITDRRVHDQSLMQTLNKMAELFPLRPNEQ